MVELVIKIPEEMYKNIQSRDWKNTGRWFSEEWKAIHNGTPLPKGHGRLIDEDQIPGDNGWDFSDRLMSTPTIIEADEAESEEYHGNNTK